jgi:hypothetical protein
MKNLTLLLAIVGVLLLGSAGTSRAGQVVVGYAPVSYPPYYTSYAPGPYYAPPAYYYPPPYAYYGPGPYYYGPGFYGPSVYFGFHFHGR